MNDNNEYEKPKSYILAHFSDIGSVQFALDVNGVTPLQMLAFASFLELRAKNELIRMENQRAEDEAQKSIARPKLVIPGK